MADFEVNIILRARDEARGVVRGLKQELQGVTGPQGGAFGNRRGDAMFGAANLATAASGVRQLTDMTKGALAAPLELAANFEQAMAEVRAVTTDSLLGDNFDKLTGKARELGASTEFTAQEVASGMKYMGVAGFDTAKQLATIAPLLDAATISGADLGQVSDVVTDVMGGFGLEAEHATMAVDSMVATTLNANTNILQLGRGLFKVAPLAKKVGVNINEVNAMLGVLANAGIKGAEGGTVLRNILLSISGKPTKDMQQALRKLGLNSKQLRKILDKEGLDGALAAINKRFHELDPSLQLFAANVLFGRRTAAGATEVLSKLTTGYADLRDITDKSGGTAAKTAEEFRSTAKASAKELKSALEELGIVIGEELMPVVRPMLEDAKDAARTFAAWAKDHPELVQGLGKVAIGIVAVGTVLGPLLLSLSSLRAVVALAGPLLGGVGRMAGGAVSAGLQKVGVSAGGAGRAVRALGLAGNALGVALAGSAVIVGIYQAKLAKLHATSNALAGDVIRNEQKLAGDLTDEELADREKLLDERAKKERERVNAAQAEESDIVNFITGGSAVDTSAADALEGQYLALRDERLRREETKKEKRKMAEEAAQIQREMERAMKDSGLATPAMEEAKAETRTRASERAKQGTATPKAKLEVEVTDKRTRAKVKSADGLDVDVGSGLTTEGL